MRLWSERYTSGQKALTWKEYIKLIECIDNIGDELLVKLAVTTGIRREDIVSILIANIDLSNNRLTYHEAKKKRDRTIDIPEATVLLIRKYLKTIPKRERLFKFSGRTAYNRFNHWCEIAGIPQRPFHALRATCIKFCQKAGWSPSQVSALTGDTIRVIQEHYETPSVDEMREVVREKPII